VYHGKQFTKLVRRTIEMMRYSVFVMPRIMTSARLVEVENATSDSANAEAA
jgi:hypothetical protein